MNRKTLEKFTCGKNKVEFQIPDCTGPACNRLFYLYIPTFFCDNSNHVHDVLPLVFSFHGLGGSHEQMERWATVVDEFRFILVIPEGFEKSWNGRYCCGYAVEHNIDDRSFIEAVIDSLPQQNYIGDTNKDFKSPFVVSKYLVYGIGASNGAFLVTNFADLFRAVAPISGHQYESSDFPNKPTSLFMHHATDDPLVHPTGCCKDPTMPRCCCGISSHLNQCKSISNVFHRWAIEVNGCKSDHNGELPYISEYNQDLKIKCHTATGDCLAETKYCMHENKGHFDKPSHAESFPMVNDIADFFAKDACSLNGGSWSSSSKSCTCKSSSQSGGFYCMAPLKFAESGSAAFLEISSTWISALGIVFLFVSHSFLKRRSKYKGWKLVSGSSID